jgi:hypothetical protein
MVKRLWNQRFNSSSSYFYLVEIKSYELEWDEEEDESTNSVRNEILGGYLANCLTLRAVSIYQQR